MLLSKLYSEYYIARDKIICELNAMKIESITFLSLEYFKVTRVCVRVCARGSVYFRHTILETSLTSCCLLQTMYNPSGNPFHFTFKLYPESDNLSSSTATTILFASVMLLWEWILTLKGPPTSCFCNHAIYHYAQACIYPFLELLFFPHKMDGQLHSSPKL